MLEHDEKKDEIHKLIDKNPCNLCRASKLPKCQCKGPSADDSSDYSASNEGSFEDNPIRALPKTSTMLVEELLYFRKNEPSIFNSMLTFFPKPTPDTKRAKHAEDEQSIFDQKTLFAPVLKPKPNAKNNKAAENEQENNQELEKIPAAAPAA